MSKRHIIDRVPFSLSRVPFSLSQKFLLLCLMSVVGSGDKVEGGYVPQSIGIEASIAKSDAIAVCKIKAVVPDPGETGQKFPTSAISLGDVLRLDALQPASTYDFEVLETIKGALPKDLHVHLPFISSRYYGGAEFKVRAESYCLLLQSKTESWVPVDETVPLIPLRGKSAVPSAENLAVKTKVYGELIASLDDAVLRPLDTYLLENVQDDAVLEACKKYVADSNRQVQSHVLRCMACNQDISAIPLIVDFEKKSKGSGCANAINKYQTSAAVPLLNDVLDSGPEYSRLNAALALRRLADPSSTPHLMKAMSNDDPQHVVAFEAYATLHDLFGPGAGEMMPCEYFLEHREAEIEKLRSWLLTHPREVSRPEEGKGDGRND